MFFIGFEGLGKEMPMVKNILIVMDEIPNVKNKIISPICFFLISGIIF